MKHLRHFEQLQEGKIYTDQDGVCAFKFIGMYNSQLAEFLELDYDEEKGDYVDTDIVRYFNHFEITDLVEA